MSSGEAVREKVSPIPTAVVVSKLFNIPKTLDGLTNDTSSNEYLDGSSGTLYTHTNQHDDGTNETEQTVSLEKVMESYEVDEHRASSPKVIRNKWREG
jgi:hypothetical protein